MTPAASLILATGVGNSGAANVVLGVLLTALVCAVGYMVKLLLAIDKRQAVRDAIQDQKNDSYEKTFDRHQREIDATREAHAALASAVALGGGMTGGGAAV